MQDWQEWTDIHGTPLERDPAWRMFDDWRDWPCVSSPRWAASAPLELCARSAKEPFRSGAIPRRPRSIWKRLDSPTAPSNLAAPAEPAGGRSALTGLPPPRSLAGHGGRLEAGVRSLNSRA